MAVISTLLNTTLPIFPFKQKIVETVIQSDVLVLCGETGSGKTTQIPQFLYQARQRLSRSRPHHRHFKMAITQPRRVAAISVANRVSQEMAVPSLGKLVGYQVRFEDCTSHETAIKFVTDGMLVREAILDPNFSQYDVIIVDEVHERSLHTDILLGLLLRALQTGRAGDLKLVIMSATLSVDSFKTFFTNTSHPLRVNSLEIPGRTHPVALRYLLEPEPDFLEATVITVTQLLLDDASTGDILVFLPGQQDIESVAESLENTRKVLKSFVILTVFAALPQNQQLEIFQPRAERRVILATNIAETSLTIPGVCTVVDCGLVKQKHFQRDEIETLSTVPISQASAVQRAGRAGRERPGNCYRLYTEKTFETLALATTPEILRSDLSTVCLQMKAMGIPEEISRFPFVDKPDPALAARAERLLVRLGALARPDKSLTELGRRMADLPVHPIWARLLLMSRQFSCLSETLTLVAVASSDNLWVANGNGARASGLGGFDVSRGDHAYLVELFKRFKSQGVSGKGVNVSALVKASNIREQLKTILKSHAEFEGIDSCGEDWDKLRRAMTMAMWSNIAKRVEGTGTGIYETLDSQQCYIHPSSILFNLRPQPEVVIFTDMVKTTKAYMRYVTPIDPAWLTELAPERFKPRQ